MGYFNLNNILYNLRKILQYLGLSLLIIFFIVLCLLLMKTSSHAETLDNNTMNFAVDNYALAQFQQSEYYNNPNYKWVMWAFDWDNCRTYNVVAVNSQVDYIFDINPSTGLFSINPDIVTFWWSYNWLYTMRDWSFRDSGLANNAWLSQTAVRTVSSQTINNKTYKYFWASSGDAFKINGSHPTISFPTNDNLIPCSYSNTTATYNFGITWTVNNGAISVSGIYNKTYFNHTYTNVVMNSTSYDYIPFVREYYGNLYYWYAKLPKGSNYYAYNNNSDNNAYKISIQSDRGFSIYQDPDGLLISDSNSNNLYNCNNFCTYGYCDNYNNSTKSVLEWSIPVLFSPPYISLPNNSTDTFINGEFSQFMVVSNNTIDELYFHLECDPNNVPITNRLDLILDENSPYYLSNYTPSDGGKVFLIPKYILPQGYLNNNLYNAWLGYTVNNQLYVTETLSWTTNFSDTAIENDRIMQQSGMYDSLNNINSFINNNEITDSNINLPSVQFDFNQEHFISDLFDALRNVFTGTTYTDFEFTFPFSNETITIPSNYIEEHCPVVILNLIRLFYWYVIGRYMLKDVFRTIDKMRQGDWFLRSDNDIKTEVL